MKTTRIEAVVSVLVPEFQHVQLEVGNGDTLSIGKRTTGVDWRELQVGQRLACVVEGESITRVISAEILD